jgi:hypothetical protein
VTTVRRWARAFGSFWWDFLVGDTPELFVAVMAIVVVALLLRHHHTAAVIVLPAMAIASLVASALRGRTGRPVQPTGSPPPPEPTSSDTNL